MITSQSSTLTLLRLDQFCNRHKNRRGSTFVRRFIQRMLDSKPLYYEVTVDERYRMSFRKDDCNLEWHLIHDGAFDPHVGSILRSVAHRGGVVYDIGANVGYFALMTALEPPATTRVVCFEPVPFTRERLEGNIRINNVGDRVRVMACGLSDTPDVAMMKFSTADCGRASLHDLDAPEFTEETPVELKTLDHLLEGPLADAPPDFIKMDIEGHELFALRGGLETLRKYRPAILMEYNDSASRAGWALPELLALLRPLTYEVWHVGDRNKLGDSKDPSAFQDLLLLPTEGRKDIAEFRKLLDHPDVTLLKVA